MQLIKTILKKKYNICISPNLYKLRNSLPESVDKYNIGDLCIEVDHVEGNHCASISIDKVYAGVMYFEEDCIDNIHYIETIKIDIDDYNQTITVTKILIKVDSAANFSFYNYDIDSKQWVSIDIQNSDYTFYWHINYFYLTISSNLQIFNKIKNNLLSTTKYVLDKGINYMPHGNILELYILKRALDKNPSISLLINFLKDNVIDLCLKVLQFNHWIDNHLYNNQYSKSYISNIKIDSEATNAKDFLKINKTNYKFLASKYDRNAHLNYANMAAVSAGWDKAWEILRIFSDDTGEVTPQLRSYFSNPAIYSKWNTKIIEFYKKTKKRYKVLAPESLSNIIVDYMDYIRLCDYYKVEPKSNLSFKDFYAEHDQLTAAYQISTNSDYDSKFAIINNEYNLKYSDNIDDYVFIFPATIDALAREGHLQRHCVKTYYTDVINKSSAIVFMRKLNDSNVPYITIQTTPNMQEVLQARGFANRSVTNKEYAVIYRWLQKNTKYNDISS